MPSPASESADPSGADADRSATAPGEPDAAYSADLPVSAAILDTLPHFTAVLSPQGAVRFVNAPSLAAVALAPADVEGVPLWQTVWCNVDAQAEGPVHLACKRAALGETVRLHAPMRMGTGPPVNAEISIAPLSDAVGRVQHLVACAVDRTERRSMDHDLPARYRRKDEFLAMLAHELRNPLAPLRNAAAMLRLTDDGQPQRKAISALVDRQVRHMARLLDDLLDASRIDQGRIVLSLEPVELGTLLAQALEGVRALTDARGQQVILERPQRQVWMNADPVRLTQIIDNLLDNASKFSEPRGTIRVSLSVKQRQAKLSVSDDGQGIDDELLPRVFDLFSQGARSLDRSQGGLGIGLSLVKNLSLMHGGAVTAASEGAGRGSTFVVTLPLISRRATAGAAVDADPAPSHAKRVLVVDDNVDAAESLAELLALKGHETKAVTESKAALEMAPAFAPEVVLLDIGLPEIDGFQVARLLRQLPCTRHSLLVAVTGYGQAEDRKASSAAGFDYHLVKPVSLRQIEELLDRRH